MLRTTRPLIENVTRRMPRPLTVARTVLDAHEARVASEARAGAAAGDVTWTPWTPLAGAGAAAAGAGAAGAGAGVTATGAEPDDDGATGASAQSTYSVVLAP